MSQFFIKRGDKAHGPFSESQIKAGLKSGKLSPKDLVSKDRSGPWRPIKIESRSEPAVAKTEDGVLGWLGEAQVKTTSQTEDQKSPRKTGYPAGIESERQRNTEKKTPTATPTTKTQAAGDPGIIHEDEQIRITEQRIKVKTVVELDLESAGEETETWLERSVFLTLDPQEITSLSLGMVAVDLHCNRAKTKNMMNTGNLFIFVPVIFAPLFWLGFRVDIAFKLSCLLLIPVGIGMIIKIVAAAKAEKPANLSAVRINITDGRYIVIPYRDETDATEVLNILDNLL